MVRPDLIRRKLVMLEGYLRELEPHRSISLEGYLTGGDRLRAIERLLQLIVEVAADINVHVVAEGEGVPPAGYADSFRAMVKLGIIPLELGDRLLPSAGLRNALVHEYGGIDDVRVHAAIPLAMDGYRSYAKAIMQWLDARPTDAEP